MPKRVALVTGGAKRVGKAIVDRLLEAGFDVAFTFNSTQSKSSRKTLAIQVDLTDPVNAPLTVYEAFTARFDRLDVLVNNASIYKTSRLRDTKIDFAKQIAAIHVQTPLMLAQRFESMLRKSRGHIVNMCDSMTERPPPQYLIYCVSKAALANLTLGLARELAPQVTVNGIAPGVVEWPDDMPKADRDKYLKRVPLARAGTPKDVANLVHFLVTEGTYITGQIIRLDGGRSIT